MRCLALIVCFLSKITGFSQEVDTQSPQTDKKPFSSYEMNFIGLGMIKTGSVTTTIPSPESNSILSNIRNGGFEMNLFEFRSFVKEKIGISMGFNYIQTNLNSQTIMNVFPSLVNGYDVSFGLGQDALSPISGSFSPIALDFGLVGKLNFGSWSVLPYCLISVNMTKNRYNLEAVYSDQNNGVTFSRTYQLVEKVDKSFKTGLDIRYNFDSPLYVGLKGTLALYKTSGESLYYDVYQDNSKLFGPTESFNREVIGLSFKIFVGIQFSKLGNAPNNTF